VTYSSSWTDHPEKTGAYTCTYPLVCRRRGMVVVRRVDSRAHWLDPAPGNAARTLFYSYEDPVTDLRGRGALGFGTFRIWDPQRPLETVMAYPHRQQVDGRYYPSASRPATVTTVVPILTRAQVGVAPPTATARVTRTYNTDETRKLHNGTVYAVFGGAYSQTKEWQQTTSIEWATTAT